MMKGSCDIIPVSEETKPEAAVKTMAAIAPERVEAMIKMAKDLRKKFPHMKPERIKRKVAEAFKVKLI